MKAALIGFVGGLAIILLFTLLKKFDKKIVYGLILTSIGFLYVGYTWSDPGLFITNSLQAIVFLFIAYFGITRGGQCTYSRLLSAWRLGLCFQLFYKHPVNATAVRLVLPYY